MPEPSFKDMQIALDGFIAAHNETAREIMARQQAHSELLSSLYVVIASLLPPDGRKSLIDDLHAVAHCIGTAAQTATEGATDPLDRANAIDLAQRASEKMAEFADNLVARFPSS